jgi:hypothetical protein
LNGVARLFNLCRRVLRRNSRFDLLLHQGLNGKRVQMTDTIALYVAACDYPGKIDPPRIETALQGLVAAMGLSRAIVRVPRGWTLKTVPAIDRMVDAHPQRLGGAIEAFAIRDMRPSADANWRGRAAIAEWIGKHTDSGLAGEPRSIPGRAGVVWDLFNTVLRSHGAINVRAKNNRRGRALALLRSQNGWDLSHLAAIAIGADANTPLPWAQFALAAFHAGCWRVIWTAETVFWAAKPEILLDEQGRAHAPNAAALVADDGDAYFWHGTVIPKKWITDRASLTAEVALGWRDIEQRRAACDMLGWHRILTELQATTIDRNDDPQVGELVEIVLPGRRRNARLRFLRVLCGTGREFALPVPRTVTTALEAQAWSWGLDVEDFIKPEIRT